MRTRMETQAKYRESLQRTGGNAASPNAKQGQESTGEADKKDFGENSFSMRNAAYLAHRRKMVLWKIVVGALLAIGFSIWAFFLFKR